MEENPKTDSLKTDEPDKGNFNFILENGLWHPNPTDILAVFEKLQQANGGPLPLIWKCPGRRAPEKNVTQEDQSSDRVDRREADSKEEKLRAPEVSAFDFDEFGADMNSKLTPRTTPGLTRTPRTEKRVAKMDNIMDSLFKQHLQRTAEKEAKRKASGTPTGRSRPFMSQRPKATVSRQLNALGGDVSESPANTSASDVALNKGASANDVALNKGASANDVPLNKGASASDVALNKGASASDGVLNNEPSNAVTSTDIKMASNVSCVTSSSRSSPTQLATTVVTLDAGDTTALPTGDTNTTPLTDNTSSCLPSTGDITSIPLSTGDTKNTPQPSGDTNNAVPPTGDVKSASPPSGDSNSALPLTEAATSVPQSVASTSPPPSQCTATVSHSTVTVSHITASGSSTNMSPDTCPQSSSSPVQATVSPGEHGATALGTEPKAQELVTNQSVAAISLSPDQVSQEPAFSKLNLTETASAERMEEG
ncbi:uncharacterized protein LOC131952979 isoform X2 [Physella acuta]|nr:uncharacterized protein LOC131952979 isoform X2 [Physella acuta]XP_059171930.1 uncharacterized protein LOC131952979 isoform X2 [Physella acuta]